MRGGPAASQRPLKRQRCPLVGDGSRVPWQRTGRVWRSARGPAGGGGGGGACRAGGPPACTPGWPRGLGAYRRGLSCGLNRYGAPRCRRTGRETTALGSSKGKVPSCGDRRRLRCGAESHRKLRGALRHGPAGRPQLSLVGSRTVWLQHRGPCRSSGESSDLGHPPHE